MQRILHVIGSLNNGGSQVVVMNLFQNVDLTKLQFDFIIDRPTELFYADEVRRLGGKIYVLPAFNIRNIFCYKKEWSNFFENHPEYKIIHGHVRSTAVIYLGIARKFGLTTIVHSHSTTSGRGFKALIKSLLQYPLRYKVDYLFACSRMAGEWLYGKKACKKDNFMIINNAIDFDKFAFKENIRLKIRSSLHLDGKFIIGHVGRFHIAKNHAYLLDIFAGIHKLRDNAVLILIGDGLLREEIEAKIASLNLKDSVYLLGYRSDIAKFMQAMDVFVFPSIWEGVPVSVIEAQAAGLPCYISDAITKEVCITPYIKQLPLSTSAATWAEQIVNTERVNREEGYKYIKESKYDVKVTADKLVKFYEGLER